MTSMTNYIMLKILKMKILANDIHIGERETNHWKWLVKTFNH